jgi:DNA-binding transcriptional ArsR family regulator
MGYIYTIVDSILQALADRTRRRILTLVWRDEHTAGEIAGHFRMSRPGVSQHLGVLLESDLVVVRRAGTRRLYRANRHAVAQLRADLGAFWDKNLSRLKIVAEVAERKKNHR